MSPSLSRQTTLCNSDDCLFFACVYRQTSVKRCAALSLNYGVSDHCLRMTRFRDCPQAMCFQVRDALRVGCIGLSKQFFSNSMEPKEMLKIIDDELRNFCILVEAAKSPFGKGALAIV